MAKKNIGKINNPQSLFYKNIEDLLDDIVVCQKLDIHYSGPLKSEEPMLQQTDKNTSNLKALNGHLNAVLYYNGLEIKKFVFSFIKMKSRVCVVLDIVPIALKLLNLAQANINEEKINLEVALDAKMQAMTSTSEVDDKQKEKEKTIKNTKASVSIKSSDSNKAGSYVKYNIKDDKEEKHIKNKEFDNESQSTNQSSCNIELDEKNIENIKLIDGKNVVEIENTIIGRNIPITMENETRRIKESKSNEALQNDLKEFLKWYNLTLDNFAISRRDEKKALNIRGRRKDGVKKEKFIQKENPTQEIPSLERKNSIEPDVSIQDMQNRLKTLITKIDDYESKRSFLKHVLTFFDINKHILLFKICASIEKEDICEAQNLADNMIDYTHAVIKQFKCVKGAENIIKDEMFCILSFPKKEYFPPSQSTGDIQTVKDGFIEENKTTYTSTPDEVVVQLNEKIIFEIDTDGNKDLWVGVQKVFNAPKSKKVIFKCKDQKAEICLNDSQITISTENSVVDISIRKPQSVDLQDNCTQTGPEYKFETV